MTRHVSRSATTSPSAAGRIARRVVGPALVVGTLALAAPGTAGAAEGPTFDRLEGPGGAPALSSVELYDISDDGSRLVVGSGADNLHPEMPATGSPVMAWDRPTNTTAILSRTEGGQPYEGGCGSGGSAVAGLVTVMRCEPPGLLDEPVSGYQGWLRDQGGPRVVSLADVEEGDDVPMVGGADELYIDESGSQVAFGNGFDDQVYLRDLSEETTILVSRTPAGDPADGASYLVDFDDDGTAVLFHSSATDLDASPLPGLFVYDVGTGDVERVSVSTAGEPGDAGTGLDGAISAGGRFVVFESHSNNLVPDDPGREHVFVRDRLEGTTSMVSVTPAGLPADGPAYDPDISDDGRYVAFVSSADDIDGAANDAQIFRHDRATGTTERLTEDADGDPGDDYSRNPMVDADGDTVAFETQADNLLPGDGGTAVQVLVWEEGTVEPACDVLFSDVPPDHQFFEDVCWAAETGVVTGYDDGTFQPTRIVNRQALAVFLWRLEGQPAGPFPATGFTDEPSLEPFRTAVRWGKAEGVIGGYDDNTFRPGSDVSRQAFVVFLWRIEGSPPGPFADPGLSDVPPGDPFHTAIEWGAAEAIVNGYDDGTFRGTSPVSRQATVAFLHRWQT